MSLCVPLGIAVILTARIDGERRHATATHPHTLVITSDSALYCRALCRTIDARGPLPRELTELREQGEAMCRRGQLRGGLARLRRALLVLQHARADAPPS